MTLEEFSNLSYADLKKLDTPTLKKLVSEKGKSLNKRIWRIEKDSDASQVSVDIVKKSGGTFRVGGKNRKALLAEAKREQRFAKGKASTVSKARAFKAEQQKAGAGITAKEYGKQKKKEYIKAETEKAKKKGKLTKAKRKAISEKAKAVEQRAKKELDKKVSEYWDEFHRWQEENPEKGSPVNVKNNVSERAFKSAKEQRQKFTKLYNNEVNKREKEYIESQESGDFMPVSETPWDLGQTGAPISQETKELEELIKQTGGIPLT